MGRRVIGAGDFRAVFGVAQAPGQTREEHLVLVVRAAVRVGYAILLVRGDETKAPVCWRSEPSRREADKAAADAAAADPSHPRHRDADNVTHDCGVHDPLPADPVKAVSALRRMMKRHADLNIAVSIPRSRPGGAPMVVLDVDTVDELAAAQAWWLRSTGEAMPSLTVLSPGTVDGAHSGGGHLWLTWPAHVDLPSRTLTLPNGAGSVIVGGYVLAPPSVRPAGPYRPLGGLTTAPSGVVAAMGDLDRASATRPATRPVVLTEADPDFADGTDAPTLTSPAAITVALDARLSAMRTVAAEAATWGDGQRDHNGDGWEKIAANWAWDLGALALDERVPLSVEGARHHFADMVKLLTGTSSGRPHLDAARKWDQQLVRAGIHDDALAWLSRTTERLSGEVLDDEDAVSDMMRTRPELRRILDASLAHMTMPQGVLACVLTRVLTATGPHVRLDTGLKSRASLNSQAVLVGVTGGGKSEAIRLAAELLRGTPAGMSGHTLASGEGLVSTFASRKATTGTVTWVARTALVEQAEASSLSDIASRPGSSLLSMLRSSWDSSAIGGVTRTTGGAPVAAHGYRLGVIMAGQPAALRWWLDDAPVGGPGRAVYVTCGADRATREAPLDAPVPDRPDVVPLDWTTPPGFGVGDPFDAPPGPDDEGYVDDLDGGGTAPGEPAELGIPMLPEQRITVDPQVTEQIWRAYLVRQQTEALPEDSTALALWHIGGHQMLVRAKLAAAFALLAGRSHVTLGDWDCAGVMMTHSSTVALPGLFRDMARVEAQRMREAGASAGRRAEAAEHAHTVAAERRVEQTDERVREWLGSAAAAKVATEGGWVPASTVVKFVRGVTVAAIVSVSVNGSGPHRSGDLVRTEGRKAGSWKVRVEP